MRLSATRPDLLHAILWPPCQRGVDGGAQLIVVDIIEQDAALLCAGATPDPLAARPGPVCGVDEWRLTARIP